MSNAGMMGAQNLYGYANMRTVDQASILRDAKERIACIDAWLGAIDALKQERERLASVVALIEGDKQ